MMKNPTILITGTTGLVGSALCHALSECGAKIIATGRNADKLSALPAQQIIVGDICDPEIFANLDGVDCIFHCAAVTKSTEMVNNPVDTILTAIDGTKNILNLARKTRCKSTVYLSSMEVYSWTTGEVFENSILPGLDPKNPRNSYPESKRFCEILCYAYYSQYQVLVKIARLSQTFGKGTSKSDSRVFAQFARSAVAGSDIILHTDGQSIGNYCELSDTVSALLTIAEKGAANEVYNISSETMTIKEMAELVADLYGTKVIIDKSQNTGAYAAPQSYTLNTDKLRGLGWNPIKTLKDAYKEMIQGWRTTAGQP
jgi:nucleoside-diphosphate-sugar epimerase